MKNELESYCQESIDQHGFLVFDSKMRSEMSYDVAQQIVAAYGRNTLMQLPEHEMQFHEWLRSTDPNVWKDLWENDPDAPYLVSVNFLPEFVGGTNKGAFLICYLQSEDNYFFTPDMLLEKESTDFVSAVRDRFLAGGTMTVEQALTVEISSGPVDIWHFAYLRGVDLQRAKQAVASLVSDRIVVHVTKAEHLSSFFDVG